MKALVLVLCLFSSPAHAGLPLTDQLIMESRIQNQLQQQQRLEDFSTSLKMQSMENEIDKLKRNQQSDVDGAALLLWIIQNRPDLLRTK
jgi:hypothetical protein